MAASPLQRPITLANGANVPLFQAASNLGLLQEYLTDPDSDWNLLYYLREVSLGRSIEPEQQRALIKALLLEPDGSLDPSMEAVVLSAVRGEGQLLHIDSPFTNSLDRAMAEFVNARAYVRSYLDEAEAKAFFYDDLAQQGLNMLRRSKKWTGRPRDESGPSPPESPSR